VRGFFVDCRGGRFAVKAAVTVDATGEAELARAAGARMVPYLEIDSGQGVDTRYRTPKVPEGMIRDWYMKKRYPRFWNDTIYYALVADVDLPAYRRSMKKKVRMPARDAKFCKKHYGGFPMPMWQALAAARRRGADPFSGQLGKDVSYFFVCDAWPDYGGVTAMRIGVTGALDSSDPVQVSRVQDEVRAAAFRMVMFMRKHAAGWDKAYIAAAAPYFSFRGGPHVEGEHTLTVEEMFEGRKCRDALYRNIHEMNHHGDPSGFDVPYGCATPKGLEGILVCGRGAAYQRRGHEPTGFRARPAMMLFGQCVGTAAAYAALDGGTKKVDIRKVQARLRKDGVEVGR
jgi:hypothetical protein